MVAMFLNPLDLKSVMAPGQYPVLQSLPLPVISVGRDRSLLVFRQHALDDAGIAVRTMLPGFVTAGGESASLSETVTSLRKLVEAQH